LDHAHHVAEFSYALVGLIAAALGAVVVASGGVGLAQGVLQIVAGLVVILLGLDLLGVSPIRNSLGFAPLAWLLKGAALFVIALGVSTLWQGVRFYLVMHKLVA
jgi:hypothetical protein